MDLTKWLNQGAVTRHDRNFFRFPLIPSNSLCLKYIYISKMNERAMCAMFMAFMTCFCFSPPGSSPPADSALMFIGILTALQSHDLAESMLVGLAAGAWCLHVYMYTYTRLLARHVTLILWVPIAELFQTELFPFNFIFMCEGPLIYVCTWHSIRLPPLVSNQKRACLRHWQRHLGLVLNRLDGW